MYRSFAKNHLKFSIVQERKNEKKYSLPPIGCSIHNHTSSVVCTTKSNSQGPDPEIAALKKRISELENKLRTVENVEKMELTAKLADANAKLLNAEIDKFKRELKDANDEWLRTWSLWFVGIIGFLVLIVGGAFWFWLRSRADQLIADSVEKNLNGFKEAIDQVDTLKNELIEAVGQINILQDQIRILEKERAASMLEATFQPDFGSELGYSRENEARREETLKDFPEEVLLNVFEDKKYLLAVRHKAAEVLASKSPPLVSPLLELLNSAIDPDSSSVTEIGQRRLRHSIGFLVKIETIETYEGLTKFLNRLLTENPEHKDIFLTWTVFSLAYISIKLNKEESASILRRTIPDLDVRPDEDHALKNLARLFDIFNEPTGIKEILTHHAADRMPEVATRCLELLEKHDPEFVRNWKAQNETTNTENEESK